jgi:phospholipase/carboxylesterase
MPDLSLIHRTAPARTGASPHPGLLLLHGRGTDEQDLLPLAAELDPRLFVVSARAPHEFPWGGHFWYDLDPQGVGYPEAATLNASLERLDRFLAEIVEKYPIDPKRLFAGGFSMGAAMSATLALLHPDRVAGAAILSGYLPIQANLPFRPAEASGHPIFEAHGIYDEVIPVLAGRLTRDALSRMPVDLTYREYPIGHQISNDELRDLSAWLTAVLDASESVPEQSAN